MKLTEQPTKNIKCIIIDDEIEACDRLQCLLEKIPHITVLTSETNADNGIISVTKLNPDIVFLDIEMPVKNGFEVINGIKNNNIYPTFIFVTGYNQYAIKAIRNATFDYLLKPVDIDELRETIGRFCNVQKENLEKILPEKLKAKYFLTDREIDVVKLLLLGKTSRDIAEILFISKHTVDTHRRKILSKTKIDSTSILISNIYSL